MQGEDSNLEKNNRPSKGKSKVEGRRIETMDYNAKYIPNVLKLYIYHIALYIICNMKYVKSKFYRCLGKDILSLFLMWDLYIYIVHKKLNKNYHTICESCPFAICVLILC